MPRSLSFLSSLQPGVLFENGRLVFSSRKRIQVKRIWSSCSLQRHPWSHPAHTVYAYLSSHQFLDRDYHLEEHDVPAIAPFLWRLQERWGLTMVGSGGERTQGQGPGKNADFLVIIFKSVKCHWACSLRCRLSGHWMGPGKQYSPHMKLIFRAHHLSQKRKWSRRKRNPRRNQDGRILEHRIRPQKCKKNFKNVRQVDQSYMRIRSQKTRAALYSKQRFAPIQ